MARPDRYSTLAAEEQAIEKAVAVKEERDWTWSRLLSEAADVFSGEEGCH